MNYLDQITAAIRRRFAPDIQQALADASQHDTYEPNNSIVVPCIGAVKILYDRSVASFVVRSRIKGMRHSKEIGWDDIGGMQVFSTRELQSARDMCQLIDFLFDQTKEQLKQKIINKELDYIINPSKAGEP